MTRPMASSRSFIAPGDCATTTAVRKIRGRKLFFVTAPGGRGVCAAMTFTRSTCWVPSFTVAVLAFAGCAREAPEGGGGGGRVDAGSDEALGRSVYETPLADGNSFSCATCHALTEPSADGLRRPGHPIGDATRRRHWKNGKAATFL